MFTRRTFPGSGSAPLASGLFAPDPKSALPNADLEKLGAIALNESKNLKAAHCDIRIIRYRRETIGVRLNPERGIGKTLKVPIVNNGISFGFAHDALALFGGACIEGEAEELNHPPPGSWRRCPAKLSAGSKTAK
jgi:hypothetical protein